MHVVALFALGLSAGCGSSSASPVGAPNPPSPSPKPIAAPPAEVVTETEPDPGAQDCPRGMLAIDGGKLRLGVPKGQGRPDEQPQREVEIDGFCVDATEVNLDTYRSCVENSICDAPPESILTEEKLSAADNERRSLLCTARFAKNLPDKQDLPVNCVSHTDAERFCKWKGARLLSEAEFEWLATAGEDRLKYPWGNGEPNANRLCWKQDDGPCPVKSSPPQVWGVYDIAGNLAEWTSSAYAPYDKPDQGGEDYSVRGGSWKSAQPDEVSGKRRGSRPPIHREVDVGFRCAKNR